MKTIKNTIAFVKVEFKGIYSWGKGWESMEKCSQWRKFWRENDVRYWKYVVDNSLNQSEYLVSTSGSAYLHPMGFDVTLTSCGVTGSDGSQFGIEIESLYSLCKQCAEACDAQLIMEVSKEAEIELYSRAYEKS